MFIEKVYVDGKELPPGVEVQEHGLGYVVQPVTADGKTIPKRSAAQPVSLTLSLPKGPDRTIWQLMREQKPRTIRVAYCADQGGPGEDGAPAPSVQFGSNTYTEMVASFHKPSDNGRESVTFTGFKPYVMGD